MNAYVAPPAGLSRAMLRISNALERYAPEGITVVQDLNQADFQVLHVIGADAIPFAARLQTPYAVMQYCTGSAGRGSLQTWTPMWNDDHCRLVWSYYDLAKWCERFYHAPLGIDRVFRAPFEAEPRDVRVITSGYVNGRGQEAIEPLVLAAHALGQCDTIHIGPKPEGLTQLEFASWLYRPTDPDLARLYRRTQWVGALRYVEGFEMGAAEGLACGARPILFDRAEARQWFHDLAILVPETIDAGVLQQWLQDKLQHVDPTVNEVERQRALARFNWKTLVGAFWARVKENM